eukprot:XP_003730108.1 PREDICTED: uncharacterized protein LOC100892311 [Strongylocentrotus purpuratus]
MTNYTGDCDAGFYCVGGADNATPMGGDTGDVCPAGAFCVQGSSYYEPCADGDYMNHTQADACYTCPARYYCYSNKINPLPCPMGYFCPLGTALPDDLCPIGKSRLGDPTFF